MSTSSRDASWLAAGTVINGLASYGFVIVGVRTYGAPDFASISILWTILTLAMGMLGFPMQNWTVYAIALRSERYVREALPAIGAVALVIAGCVAAMSWAYRVMLFGSPDNYYPALVFTILIGATGTGLCRGVLASRGRFFTAGLVLGGESIIRLLAAIVLIVVGLGVDVLGVALALGFIIVLVVPESLKLQNGGEGVLCRWGVVRGFMSIVIGSTLGLMVINAAPVVMPIAGASKSDITSAFAIMALFRSPYLIALGASSKVTQWFSQTDSVKRNLAGDRADGVLALVGIIGAGASGVFGVTCGLPLSQYIFGDEIYLEPVVIGVIAGASWLAVITLMQSLLLVGRQSEDRQTVSWVLGVGIAAGVFPLLPGGGALRVTSAVLVAEAVAFIALWFSGVRVLGED